MSACVPTQGDSARESRLPVVRFDVPFRWDVRSRSTLGAVFPEDWSLPGAVAVHPGFGDWLTRCCAHILARSEQGDLYFVGRSPENLYDHLCGLLADTSWAGRVHLLQFSAGAGVKHTSSAAIVSFRRYCGGLGLDPRAIAERGRPIVFVDLVCGGGTLGNLVRLLHSWARECGVPWRAVKPRLRIVALVNASWHSGTDRLSANDWQETSDWVPRYLAPRAVHNIALPSDRWCFLGNDEAKVTPSYTPSRWGTEEAATRPAHWAERTLALPLAFGLYAYGKTRERRLLLARLLARDVAMKQVWCRQLVCELR